MSQSLVQKILAKASGKGIVDVGDVVEPKVDMAMSHENAALVINQFNEIYKGLNATAKVWNPYNIAIIFDHRVPAESRKTATNQKKIRSFVNQQGISKFHDIRGDEGGICHQVLPENGYVLPGSLVVGTDSHTTTHGALGAFSFGIGATEMASVWALGTVLNVEVPASIKAIFEGEMPPYVQPKDLILNLIGKLTAQGANFKVIEYHGSTIREMNTSGRLTICNMSVEAGATSGIVPPDVETIRYLREVAGVRKELDLIQPDEDYKYDRIVEIDVTKLEPQIAKPHTVDNVCGVSEVEGQKVDQIVIGSCTNGRIEDIKSATDLLRGRKVAKDVRMLVFPASYRVYNEALDKGYIKDLTNAGAVVMNPGCGPCLGIHQGALGDDEVALSTTNRNFKGRMGNPNASVYLSSAAVAAASALTGVITNPQKGGY
jgi:3-isopropylmalate/(R)-2-methylmalate dehydratase large subunit